MISTLAFKVLNSCGKRAVRMTAYNILRMSSSGESCNKDASKQEPCNVKQEAPKQEPCPASKPDPCPPKAEGPAQPVSTSCSEPPPCATMPKCPSTLCPPALDRNNPCYYCPPVCIDPNYPDLTRLKKWQCFFQQDDGIPLFLKRGNIDAFLYQALIVLIITCFAHAMYCTFKLIVK